MLIFLDIDGVMIPAKSWQRPEIMEDGFPAFSRAAVRVLQHLTAQKVTIILTTSHKAKFSIETWKALFKNRGITIAHLNTLPENSEHLSRKEELEQWFRLHPAEDDFIIIDDDKSLNELPCHLRQRLIQPNPFLGLNEEHLVMIKSLFPHQIL